MGQTTERWWSTYSNDLISFTSHGLQDFSVEELGKLKPDWCNWWVSQISHDLIQWVWKLMEMDFYKDLGTFSSWNDPSDSVEKNENHPQEATVQLRMSGLLFAHHPCKAMSYIWLYLMGNISGYIRLYHPVEGKLVTSDYSCDCEPLWPWILVADDLAPPKKMEQSRMFAMAFSQDNFPGFPLFMRRLP